MTGAAGIDAVDGGSGVDTIRATANGTVITLSSLAGVEAITADGHSGVLLRGTTAADVLDFSGTTLTGIVSIDGGKGNDVLTGSAGDDTIIGGLGRDTMAGGMGSDSGVFVSAGDSRRGVNADLITGFTTGADKIDLSVLDADPLTAGDQAFVFVASAAFSHTAGELRVVGSSAGYGILSVDFNGDGLSDFDLHLTGADGLAYVLIGADLIL